MTKQQAERWARYDLWDERQLSRDRFAVDDPERGFRATDSPADPRPSLVIDARRVVEMQKLSGKNVPDDFVFRLVADSICDETGKLLITVEQAEEQMDILTAQELMAEILDFNRVSKKPDEAKNDLKNAPTTSS